jgi:Mg2+ and Co2+ transporter CorA
VLDPRRNKSSPLDEIVLHWTQIANKELIQSAREHSVNSTHYLLKYLANLWVHSLDLVQSTIAQSEYFSEEYQAKVDMNISSEEWRQKLTEVVSATSDMHNLRRQMIHFEYQLGLNLERLGIVLGAEKVNPLEQDAIRGAQMDFLNLYNRLKPFVARAIVLDKTANDLANFYTNFIGIQYSQVGLKLSIFASVVFPATLVSSIFSMGTDYLPGQPLFWVFWAVTIPVVLAVAGGMLFSQYIESWFTQRLGPRSKKAV